MVMEIFIHFDMQSTLTANIIAFSSLIIAFVGFIVSVIVLVFTYKTWKMKHGCKVVGSLGYSSEITSSTPFISEIVLHKPKRQRIGY